MRYGAWVECSPPSILDDPPVLRGVTERLVDRLFRQAEREGVAVDLGTVGVETSQPASFFIRDRVALMARADVGYQFRPLGDQIAAAVRWRKWWRP